MRFIGSIPDLQQATRFGDYLTALGIANNVEQGSSGFAIWVHNDDYIDRSRSELTTFLSEPDAGRFAEATKAAQRVRDEQEQREKSLRKNYVDVRTRWSGLSNRTMPATIVLVAISLLVGALTKLSNQRTPVGEALSFGTLTDQQENEAFARQFKKRVRESIGWTKSPARKFELQPPGLQNILRGEVWRLFTPMFLHFGIVHLLFNMMWLVDLGGAIERKLGTLKFLGIVLFVEVLSNFAQFYWDGPYFGGMSGVVYGLFGFVWIKSKFDPQSGFAIGKQTVLIMLGWLVLCMTGLVGDIANAAHVAGLVTGMVLAHAPHSWRQMKRRQRAA
ncbi:rhomboid family intramembrane serine protease [soil metagenome]